eukprot:6411016-Amphidinium_carterae.1
MQWNTVTTELWCSIRPITHQNETSGFTLDMRGSCGLARCRLRAGSSATASSMGSSMKPTSSCARSRTEGHDTSAPNPSQRPLETKNFKSNPRDSPSHEPQHNQPHRWRRVCNVCAVHVDGSGLEDCPLVYRVARKEATLVDA